MQQQAGLAAEIDPLGAYLWPRTEHLRLPSVLEDDKDEVEQLQMQSEHNKSKSELLLTNYPDMSGLAVRQYCESLIAALQSVGEPSDLEAAPSASAPGAGDEKVDEKSPLSASLSSGKSPKHARKREVRGFELVRMTAEGEMVVDSEDSDAEKKGEKVVSMSTELKRELATPGLLDLLRSCSCETTQNLKRRTGSAVIDDHPLVDAGRAGLVDINSLEEQFLDALGRADVLPTVPADIFALYNDRLERHAEAVKQRLNAKNGDVDMFSAKKKERMSEDFTSPTILGTTVSAEEPSTGSPSAKRAKVESADGSAVKKEAGMREQSTSKQLTTSAG